MLGITKRLAVLMKSLLYLGLILSYSMILVVFGLFCELMVQKKYKKNSGNKGKNVLITTAKMSKSLHLIRNIKMTFPEYNLYCTDANYVYASKYSRMVTKGFTIIYPDSKNTAVLREFIDSMISIIKEYKIDVIVPGCGIEEAKCLSILKTEVAKLDLHCNVLIDDENIVSQLDDKDRFFDMFNERDIVGDFQLSGVNIKQAMNEYYKNQNNSDVIFPFSVKFTNKARLMKFIENENLLVNSIDNGYKYILKRIVLSNNRNEHIIRLPTANKYLLDNIIVNENEPWILQDYINGNDVAAFIYTDNGDIKVYCDSICCDACVNYYPINNSDIKEWLSIKCNKFNLTGLMCFDLIERDNKYYILECNPRPHSLTTLMKDPVWIKPLMDNNSDTQYIYDNAEHVFWLFHEILRIFGVLNMFPAKYDQSNIMNKLYRKDKPYVSIDEFGYINFNIKDVLVGRDAVLNVYDPWPVIVSHMIHMPKLIIHQIFKGCNGWSVFDMCIVKLVLNEL